MRFIQMVTLVCLFCSTTALQSQNVRVQYHGETTVEVIGLKRWSLKSLEDSLQRHVPGQTLADAACMATLRYKLGFADASVTVYSGFERDNPNRKFVAVRLVEPQKGSIWRTLPSDRYESLLPLYAPLILPVTDSAGNVYVSRLLFGYQQADSGRRELLLSGAGPRAREDYNLVATFVRSNEGGGASDRALRVLDSGAAPSNRIAAAIVLLNQSGHDASWYSLVRALRDPHEGVRLAASTVLGQYPRRAVDWKPVASDLRELLSGVNVSETEKVMRLLIATKVDPALASTLLRKNSGWVLRLLESKAPMTATSTRAFLVALNRGTDLGSSATSWRTWLNKL
jgi:hypothetical protein